MEHRAERLVLHVDMDCFYAAVEEREQPRLRGRPVVVGSDPKGGIGRGIVATCNYEARRYGLRSAMPISTAFRLCPKAVFLRPRFPLYAKASQRVMQILRAEADCLEQVGVDEAYLDASSRGSFEAARELARRVQSRVREEERLSCSIGVGPNKLIAKLASEHKKPRGVTVVIGSRVLEFLDPKGVGALRGVGPKTRERLEALGFFTVAQLRAAPRAALEREFGRFGEYLHEQSRGLDARPVDPAHETKSIGREHTFERDSDDPQLLRATLDSCVRRVHRDLLEENLWCRTLTVKIRYEGYETHSRQTTLRLATGGRSHLRAGAQTLAEPFFSSGRRLRLVGFSVSRFGPPEELLPLLED